MKFKTVTLSELRKNMKHYLEQVLEKGVTLSVTSQRVLRGYIVHPEAFGHAYRDPYEYACPSCQESVVILPTLFNEKKYSAKPQMKKMVCPHCYEGIYAVRDLRPVTYLMGEKPKGFEK